MNWINVEDKHFVDIEWYPDGKTYSWIQSHTPNKPFLVGLNVYNNEKEKTSFEYYFVILTEYGLEEYYDNDSSPLGWEVTDIEYWCEIEVPEV